MVLRRCVGVRMTLEERHTARLHVGGAYEGGEDGDQDTSNLFPGRC